MISTLDKAFMDVNSFVRNSNIHFTSQETPFSLYITVRKKFVKNNHDEIIMENESNHSVDNSEIID